MPRRWTQKEARAVLLGLPEVEAASHMGRPDFRVGGRIFATLPEDGESVNLRLPPSQIEMLVAAQPKAFTPLWKGQYLGVTLSRVAPGVLESLLRDAWVFRATPKLRAAHAAQFK